MLRGLLYFTRKTVTRCESKGPPGPVKGNLAVRAAALRGEDCSDKINTPDTNRDFIDNINPMQCGVEEVSGVLA